MPGAADHRRLAVVRRDREETVRLTERQRLIKVVHALAEHHRGGGTGIGRAHVAGEADGGVHRLERVYTEGAQTRGRIRANAVGLARHPACGGLSGLHVRVFKTLGRDDLGTTGGGTPTPNQNSETRRVPGSYRRCCRFSRRPPRRCPSRSNSGMASDGRRRSASIMDTRQAAHVQTRVRAVEGWVPAFAHRTDAGESAAPAPWHSRTLPS